jgi:hypothetical protein
MSQLRGMNFALFPVSPRFLRIPELDARFIGGHRLAARPAHYNSGFASSNAADPIYRQMVETRCIDRRVSGLSINGNAGLANGIKWSELHCTPLSSCDHSS